jgi:hypothetical protein
MHRETAARANAGGAVLPAALSSIRDDFTEYIRE